MGARVRYNHFSQMPLVYLRPRQNQPLQAICISICHHEMRHNNACAPFAAVAGFNVDWEPTDGAGNPVPTAADATAYAAFLTVFSDAMHQAGLVTSVDVATWSAIWNLTAIGESSVDMVISMGTYTVRE